MYALSVRQPWAFGISHLGKDVENRSRPTKIRGRILIHASLYRPSAVELRAFIAFVADIHKRRPIDPEVVRRWRDIPFDTLPRGGFVCTAEIVDCVERHSSPWRSDASFAYVLANPNPIAFRPAKGQRGFWRVPGAEDWT